VNPADFSEVGGIFFCLRSVGLSIMCRFGSSRVRKPNHAIVIVFMLMVLGATVSLQYVFDQHQDRAALQIEDLAQIPRGEYLKPVLLGYQHLGADVLWLRMVQVLGKKWQTSNDFEWLYHTLDVITSLDPQYTYAYQVGGIVLTETAHRVDLSNRILQKGLDSNANAWWLPFNLGYNYFFYLGDAKRAAEYMAQAARLPGRPAYVPGLATRMYAEAGNADVALDFLEAMSRQTNDERIKHELEIRIKELVLERDLGNLERASNDYHQHHREIPKQLQDLVADGRLAAIPQEPFGGEYVLDSKTGKVTSSTHPSRLHVYRPSRAGSHQQKDPI
jgi:hypothetical protein